jgi:hypothetical protein
MSKFLWLPSPSFLSITFALIGITLAFLSRHLYDSSISWSFLLVIGVFLVVMKFKKYFFAVVACTYKWGFPAESVVISYIPAQSDDELIAEMESIINPSLSPAENAINMLNSILVLPEVSPEIKLRLLYCIDTLGKRAEEQFVPLGLLDASASHCQEDEYDASVHEWLLSQFSEV